MTSHAECLFLLTSLCHKRGRFVFHLSNGKIGFCRTSHAKWLFLEICFFALSRFVLLVCLFFDVCISSSICWRPLTQNARFWKDWPQKSQDTPSCWDHFWSHKFAFYLGGHRKIKVSWCIILCCCLYVGEDSFWRTSHAKWLFLSAPDEDTPTFWSHFYCFLTRFLYVFFVIFFVIFWFIFDWFLIDFWLLFHRFLFSRLQQQATTSNNKQQQATTSPSLALASPR